MTATLTTRRLTPETWADFASLVEANNGVWGGCWCIGFHPGIKNPRAHERGLVDLPDWRIGCVFTGSGFRRHGVARAGVAAVLSEIETAGGGVVEAYPEQLDGRSPQRGAYLHTGPESLFAEFGFVRDRRIAKWRWVMRRVIPDPAEVGARRDEGPGRER